MKIVRKIIRCACGKELMAFVPEDTNDYLCEECEHPASLNLQEQLLLILPKSNN